MDPVVDLLRDLVAIDSVNPSLVPGGAGEAAVAEHVADVLRKGGIDVELTEVAPRRPNVVGGAVRSDRGGPPRCLKTRARYGARRKRPDR